jgi:prophage DNA circulation protein
MATPPWKLQLYPATFRGAVFHVEVREKASGRRDFVHEFPNRDQPYSEDLGRRARRFTVAGYVIGPNYITDRDALITALEADGPGALVLPTQGSQQVQVDHYSVIERREKGGMAEIEMTFTEAGAVISTAASDTAGNVTSTAQATLASVTGLLDSGLIAAGAPGS